jgi:two-component system sensor histidine kinase YesM
MRNRVWGTIRSNSLFLKVVMVVVSSVILVSMVTTWVAFQTSEAMYINLFSQSNRQMIQEVSNRLETFREEISSIVSVVGSSWAFRSYFNDTVEHSSADESYIIYSMQKQISAAMPGYSKGDYDLLVVGVNKSSFVMDETRVTTPVDEILQSGITQEAIRNPSRISYFFCEKGFTNKTAKGESVIAVKPLINLNTSVVYGLVYVCIPQDTIRRYYKNFSNEAVSLMIVDNNGRIVSADNSEFIGNYLKDPKMILEKGKENGKGYINTEINGKQVFTITRHINYWDLNIIGVIDRETALKNAKSLNTILWVSLFATALIIIVVFFIIRKTTKPISTLVKKMPAIINGNFAEHIPVRGGYEARELTTAFNYMLDGLHNYVNRLMESENEKRKAEIQSLQMQINLHFIYNTLTSAKWLIWKKENDKAEQVIDAFSLLLRNTIGNWKELITAREEMENLRNYALLQQLRYGGQIRVELTLEEDCGDCLIPKLLLQPFLENSFFHAFQNRDQGVIHVFISRRGKTLVSEIIDNGAGMNQNVVDELLNDRVQKHEHFSGLGIANVNDRIHLLYGKEYGVYVSSELGEGTVIVVTIPVQREKSDKA